MCATSSQIYFLFPRQDQYLPQPKLALNLPFCLSRASALPELDYDERQTLTFGQLCVVGPRCLPGSGLRALEQVTYDYPVAADRHTENVRLSLCSLH